MIETEEDETLDSLCDEALRIVQKKDGYRFSIDAIFLANFVILKKHERLLDIGTGCGIIPIYISKKGFKNSMVGAEIQKELFDVACKNKVLNCCENVQFFNIDIRSKESALKETLFHVAVSNPPFTKADTGRKSPKPSRCLARYESSLSLSETLSLSSSLLYEKGRLYMIFPSRRLGELVYTAKLHKFEPKKLRFIHPRKGEPSNLFLAEFIKAGGIGVTVHQPLYVYEDGSYTDEVRNYYSFKD